MRSAKFALGCIALTILLAVLSIPTFGFAQTGIVVSPENPTELDSLEIIITAGCCMMPAYVLDTAVEFSEGLIKIDANRACGPLTMPTFYTHTVIVPPVEPNSYTIEYWVTGDCLFPPNPILTTTIIVLPTPIQVEGSTWGAIKELYK